MKSSCGMQSGGASIKVVLGHGGGWQAVFCRSGKIHLKTCLSEIYYQNARLFDVAIFCDNSCNFCTSVRGQDASCNTCAIVRGEDDTCTLYECQICSLTDSNAFHVDSRRIP